MRLVDLIPDADVLCALEPDELALRMLPVLAEWPQHIDLTVTAFVGMVRGNNQLSAQYPLVQTARVEQAIREAWSWLEGAALLIDHQRYHPPTRFACLAAAPSSLH